MGEYFALVHGRPHAPSDPEARNRFPVSEYECLLQPTAIFKGLRRSLHDGKRDVGDDFLVYVSTPPHTGQHIQHRDFGSVLKIAQPPIDSVFTVYVSLDPNHLDGMQSGVHKLLASRDGAPAVSGIVSFWEWTERSRVNPAFPEDFKNRYGPRLL